MHDWDEWQGWLLKVAYNTVPKSYHSRYLSEVISEARLALWLAMESYDPDRAPRDYWLKHKMHGAMKQYMRDLSVQKRDFRLTVPVDTMDERPYDDPKEIEALDSLLSPLNEQEREYVYLRFWRGWQYKELNAHFKMKHAQNIWTRARPKLRKHIEKNGELFA